MTRLVRITPAVLLLCATSAAFAASSVDRDCIPDAFAPAANAPSVEVVRSESPAAQAPAGDSRFAAKADVPARPDSPMEIVVARIGPDGKLVLACVDNEDAKRRFLDAPIERVQVRTPQEK